MYIQLFISCFLMKPLHWILRYFANRQTNAHTDKYLYMIAHISWQQAIKKMVTIVSSCFKLCWSGVGGDVCHYIQTIASCQSFAKEHVSRSFFPANLHLSLLLCSDKTFCRPWGLSVLNFSFLIPSLLGMLSLLWSRTLPGDTFWQPSVSVALYSDVCVSMCVCVRHYLGDRHSITMLQEHISTLKPLWNYYFILLF